MATFSARTASTLVSRTGSASALPAASVSARTTCLRFVLPSLRSLAFLANVLALAGLLLGLHPPQPPSFFVHTPPRSRRTPSTSIPLSSLSPGPLVPFCFMLGSWINRRTYAASSSLHRENREHQGLERNPNSRARIQFRSATTIQQTSTISSSLPSRTSGTAD